MLCKRNCDVTNNTLFIALFQRVRKFKRHGLAVVSMQHALREGNSVAFWKRRSESVSDWRNDESIQSAYFGYDSDFLKCTCTSERITPQPQPNRPALDLSTPEGWEAELTLVTLAGALCGSEDVATCNAVIKL